MTDQADTIQRLRALVYQQGDEIERLRAQLAEHRPEQPAEQDRRCGTCAYHPATRENLARYWPCGCPGLLVDGHCPDWQAMGGG